MIIKDNNYLMRVSAETQTEVLEDMACFERLNLMKHEKGVYLALADNIMSHELYSYTCDEILTDLFQCCDELRDMATRTKNKLRSESLLMRKALMQIFDNHHGTNVSSKYFNDLEMYEYGHIDYAFRIS